MTSVDMNVADGIDAAIERGQASSSSLTGYPPAMVTDLIKAQQLVAKVIKRHPWVDNSFDKSRYRRFDLDKRSGEYRQSELDKGSYGVRMVNAMLTMYSNATCSFCESKGVSVPIAWENRPRAVFDGKAIRHTTTAKLARAASAEAGASSSQA